MRNLTRVWRRSARLILPTALASITVLAACSPTLDSAAPNRNPTVAVNQAAVAEIASATPRATDTPRATPSRTATSTPSTTPTPEDTATPTVSPTPLIPPEQVSDVLGRGRTSYAGSIPPRRHNVELAIRRLNAVKVAPGAVFSFNQALGPSTLDAGFQVGYGITLDNNRPRTIPSVAGGICQVATTLFQAAYWAGLEMVERNYHLYWIPRYGQPPTGVTGLDATVDDPGADLRFRNTTGNWIRIESWADGGEIGFTIYGVDPGWKIETEGPFVTNRVRADHTYVREQTLSLPPGQQVGVEHAEDGFDVSMTRRVIKDGELLSTYRFFNHYRPSRNVVLVGVSSLASPTPEETPEETPEATPSETPNPVVTSVPVLEPIDPTRPTTPLPTLVPISTPRGRTPTPAPASSAPAAPPTATASATAGAPAQPAAPTTPPAQPTSPPAEPAGSPSPVPTLPVLPTAPPPGR